MSDDRFDAQGRAIPPGRRIPPQRVPCLVHAEPIVELDGDARGPLAATVRIRSGLYAGSFDPEPISLCWISVSSEDLLPAAFTMYCRLDGRQLAHFSRVLFEGPYGNPPRPSQPTTTLAELLGPKGILKVMAAIETAQAWLPPLIRREPAPAGTPTQR